MTFSTQLLLAAVVALGVGGAVFAAGQALSPAPPAPATGASRPRVLPVLNSTLVTVAVISAMAVLVVTRWPVAAAAVAGLVLAWPALFPTDAVVSRQRLEGIAKWLEDLRDLQSGSNLDLLETLDQASRRAPKAITAELSRFSSRTGHHQPLGEALLELADDLDHPVADTAVAAMLFAAGDASGSSLHATFSLLADTARDELVARDRIDRMRLNFQRSMRRMLMILAGLIAYMVIVATDTLAPYRTATGQVWLVVPVGVWALSLVWLRRLSRYEDIGRYISQRAVSEATGR
jgi:hypothetical protein